MKLKKIELYRITEKNLKSIKACLTQLQFKKLEMCVGLEFFSTQEYLEFMNDKILIEMKTNKLMKDSYYSTIISVFKCSISELIQYYFKLLNIELKKYDDLNLINSKVYKFNLWFYNSYLQELIPNYIPIFSFCPNIKSLSQISDYNFNKALQISA